jgi:hypothetical protein
MQGPVQLVQTAGGQQYMMPIPAATPIVYQSPLPTQQPTIVIDTGPRVMQEGGYMEDQMAAEQGMPVMGIRPRNNVTPRARPMSPRRGPATVNGQAPTKNVQFTFTKLG